MRALITGVTGQDGSYLSEILKDKGYEVYGVMRRASTINTSRIDHIFDPTDSTFLKYGDLTEGIENLINDINPDEIYNLGAMSHVKVSFDTPVYTANVNALGPLRILEAIRKVNDGIKFYQASSSEMFGTTPAPQNENSIFNPVSPYGCAKLFAYHATRAYRTGYGIHACNGILFNHESHRRGHNFVTQKVVRGLVEVKKGLRNNITLGNLDAKRDWGHSKDYMRAVHMILTHDKADDWVVSTGDTYTVREFVDIVLNKLGLTWKSIVLDDRYKRPNEVPELCGDSTKIREKLGWKPEYTLETLIEEMIDEAEKDTRRL